MIKRPRTRRLGSCSTKSTWPPWALLGFYAFLILGALWLSLRGVSSDAPVIVYKTPQCSCCIKWVRHLRDSGLEVSVIDVPDTASIQARAGVPEPLRSCHTARIGERWVEGHVPADLVRQLVDGKLPEVRGLAVPGMPAGSPGMEGPDPVSYDVIAFDLGGETRVIATREGRDATD